ncbi:MAG: hypothetical protein WCG80_07080 [Spirochaetales bacterium]
MSTEVIKGDDYSVEYHPTTSQLFFRGTIRLQTTEDYVPVMELMQKAHAGCAEGGTNLIMDFSHLEFLNSSGINAISKFVIATRKEAKICIDVLGNKDIYWQQKSLQNLQKLWAKVTITIS